MCSPTSGLDIYNNLFTICLVFLSYSDQKALPKIVLCHFLAFQIAEIPQHFQLKFTFTTLCSLVFKTQFHITFILQFSKCTSIITTAHFLCTCHFYPCHHTLYSAFPHPLKSCLFWKCQLMSTCCQDTFPNCDLCLRPQSPTWCPRCSASTSWPLHSLGSQGQQDVTMTKCFFVF